MNGNTAFAHNFYSTDENELSFNYTYRKENGKYKGCLQSPSFTEFRELLYNFVANSIACVFPSIMDILVDRIMHDDFVDHISDQNRLSTFIVPTNEWHSRHFSYTMSFD